MIVIAILTSRNNEFYSPIFIFRKNKITRIRMKKIFYLLAFSFDYISFSFRSKIFLLVKNTTWLYSTVYILTKTDLVHNGVAQKLLYHFHDFLKFQVMTYIFQAWTSTLNIYIFRVEVGLYTPWQISKSISLF